MNEVRISKVNLTAVAESAGVSIATASRVLNGSANVAPLTGVAVRQAAEELGYVPDPRFRLMGKGRSRQPGKNRTGNIGVLLYQLTGAEFATNPYYSRLFWGIEREVSELGQHVIISTMKTSFEVYVPTFLTDFKVDGVLVADRCPVALLERIEQLVPVVLVNSTAPKFAAVMPDEDSGMRQALTYLRELGHRRIWYFDIHDTVPANLHHGIRTQAFKSYTTGWGMSEARSVVLSQRTSPLAETCLDLLRQWRDGGSMPTAIICGTDAYASSFLHAAEMIGVKIPDELSVVGADDTFLCEYVRPTLTSIRQPFEEMGAAAVRMLMQQVEKRSGSRTTQIFDVSLVVRESCQPLKGSRAAQPAGEMRCGWPKTERGRDMK